MIFKEKELESFKSYLEREEKSRATCEKYMRDVRHFRDYIGDREITKKEVINYKELLKVKYAPSSVNSMLIALNRFLKFMGEYDCSVRLLKLQKQMFCDESKELSVEEYKRLIKAAGDQKI